MVYTNKVKTAEIKDLSSMTGKKDEFKKLIESEVVSLAGSFDTDNVVSLYEEVTSLYKQKIEAKNVQNGKAIFLIISIISTQIFLIKAYKTLAPI